jgi:hypothetical protein
MQWRGDESQEKAAEDYGLEHVAMFSALLKSFC